MKLTVIGCSGSYPGPDSPASCYLVEANDGDRTWRVLLDFGNGALGYLHRYADPLAIDAVLVSHLHADHCLDLCGYYVMRKYHPEGPQPRIPVWGPPDTAERMARAYDLDSDPGMNEEFDFRGYDGDSFGIGPLTVTPVRVAHPVAAYALRMEHDGHVLTYSGDTGACGALLDAAKDADLLLCEASFVEGADNPADIHLTGREAGSHATGSGARRLVLTHIPPWYAAETMLREARETYDGPLEAASVGATYDV